MVMDLAGSSRLPIISTRSATSPLPPPPPGESICRLQLPCTQRLGMHLALRSLAFTISPWFILLWSPTHIRQNQSTPSTPTTRYTTFELDPRSTVLIPSSVRQRHRYLSITKCTYMYMYRCVAFAQRMQTLARLGSKSQNYDQEIRSQQPSRSFQARSIVDHGSCTLMLRSQAFEAPQLPSTPTALVLYSPLPRSS